jgi:hypothetical protein
MRNSIHQAAAADPGLGRHHQADAPVAHSSADGHAGVQLLNSVCCMRAFSAAGASHRLSRTFLAERIVYIVLSPATCLRDVSETPRLPPRQQRAETMLTSVLQQHIPYGESMNAQKTRTLHGSSGEGPRRPKSTHHLISHFQLSQCFTSSGRQ